MMPLYVSAPAIARSVAILYVADARLERPHGAQAGYITRHALHQLHTDLSQTNHASMPI